MAHAPIAPRLVAQLEAWYGAVEDTLEIDQALVGDIDISAARKLIIDGSRLERVTLAATTVDKCELTDVVCSKLEAAAVQLYRASFSRVTFSNCRFSGAEFAEADFEDCIFKDVKCDNAGFRFARFKRVRFENCLLNRADFSNAKMSQVTITDCELDATNFMSLSAHNLDITTEDLSRVRGILGLKGATISSIQLMQLAPLLATELGFHVKD